MGLKNKIIFAGSILSVVAMPIVAISCGSDNKKNASSPKLGFSNKHISWIIENRKGEHVPGTESHDTQAGAEADLRSKLLFNTKPVRIARDSDSTIDKNIYSGVHEINYDTLKVGYVKQDGSIERSKSNFKQYINHLFNSDDQKYAYGTEFLAYTKNGHIPYTDTTEWRFKNRILAFIHDHPNMKQQFIDDIKNSLYDSVENLSEGLKPFVSKYDSYIANAIHPYIDKDGHKYLDESEVVMRALNDNGALTNQEYNNIDEYHKTHSLEESLKSTLHDIEYQGQTYSSYELAKNAIFTDLRITIDTADYYRYSYINNHGFGTLIADPHDFTEKNNIASLGYDYSDDYIFNPSITSTRYEDSNTGRTMHLDAYTSSDYIHLTKDKNIAIKYSILGNFRRKNIGYDGPSLFSGNWEYLTLNDMLDGDSYIPAVQTKFDILQERNKRGWNDFDNETSYYSRLLDTRTFDYSPYFDVSHPDWDLIPAMKFTYPQGETKYFKLSDENFMNIDRYYQINQVNAFAYWWMQQGVDVHDFLETLKTSFGYHIAKIEK